MHRETKLSDLGILGVLLVAILLAAGCVTGQTVDQVMPASDLPERFMVVEDGKMRPARADEGCRNPMADPRTGTRIELYRSSAAQGDYSVAEGAYGADRGWLLRIDCVSGEAIGLVRR